MTQDNVTYAPPASGSVITKNPDGTLNVPNDPILPFIEGDGTGPDIWAASRRVFDEAVRLAYGGAKKIHWYEIYAGEKAFNRFGQWLPDATLDAIKKYRVAIKGPADHSGGRRHPQLERHASPGTRPLRLRPPGALHHRACPLP